MRKLIPILFAAIGLSIALVVTTKADPIPSKSDPSIVCDFDAELHTKCLYPTIRISNKDVSQKSTGFIIRSEKIEKEYYNVAITCDHCVDDDETYFADIHVYEENGTKFKDYERYPVIVYAQNSKLDLAVIVFRTPNKQPTVALDFDRKICIGNEVFHFGCGLGEEARYETGHVNSLKGKAGSHPTDLYRVSVFTIMGDSGGPVFYNKDRKVIGITQAIKATSFRGLPAMLNHISMVIPIGTLKTWDTMENNNLRFLYTSKADLPRFPYAMLAYEPIDWEKVKSK
jgi:hypothetical protein